MKTSSIIYGQRNKYTHSDARYYIKFTSSVSLKCIIKLVNACSEPWFHKLRIMTKIIWLIMIFTFYKHIKTNSVRC